MTIQPGKEVFFNYTIPFFNLHVSGYGRVIHADALVGTDPAYAIQVANGSVAYVRQDKVEEVL